MNRVVARNNRKDERLKRHLGEAYKHNHNTQKSIKYSIPYPAGGSFKSGKLSSVLKDFPRKCKCQKYPASMIQSEDIKQTLAPHDKAVKKCHKTIKIKKQNNKNYRNDYNKQTVTATTTSNNSNKSDINNNYYSNNDTNDNDANNNNNSNSNNNSSIINNNKNKSNNKKNIKH